jgi:hypothetical protein
MESNADSLGKRSEFWDVCEFTKLRVYFNMEALPSTGRYFEFGNWEVKELAKLQVYLACCAGIKRGLSVGAPRLNT